MNTFRELVPNTKYKCNYREECSDKALCSWKVHLNKLPSIRYCKTHLRQHIEYMENNFPDTSEGLVFLESIAEKNNISILTLKKIKRILKGNNDRTRHDLSNI